jgi:hypothetical protein
MNRCAPMRGFRVFSDAGAEAIRLGESNGCSGAAELLRRHSRIGFDE